MTSRTPLRQHLAILADRHPGLSEALLAWLASHLDVVPDPGPGAEVLCVRQADIAYFFGCPAAGPVAGHLSRNPDDRAVQVFPDPAQFLYFLTDPGAGSLISSSRWQPWVICGGAFEAHVDSALEALDVGQWPWSVPGAPAAAYTAFARRLHDRYRRRIQDLIDRLARTYAGWPPPDRTLAAGERPLRVLSIAHESSSYQRFCARDITAGLEADGVEARTLLLTNAPQVQFDLLGTLDEFRPDILLCNGTSRADYSGLPRGLTVLSWDQDYVLSCSERYAAARHENDRLRVMVRDWLADAAEQGLSGPAVGHLDLGTNHRLFHPPVEAVEPAHDVLFVGNIYPFDVYRQMIGFDTLAGSVQRGYLHARERLQAWVRAGDPSREFVLPDIDALLRASFAELGIATPVEDASVWRRVVYYFRYRIAHFVLREEYVAALADHDLGLYGRGWDCYPALAGHARPPIENGRPLRDAIHASLINLHLHTWTVHHPRLYDTAAAGGFLLVGRVPESHPLAEVFEVGPGREVDSFGSIVELREKIRHYLDRPDLRQRMAANAVRRVLREHTMEHRMAELIGSLRA